MEQIDRDAIAEIIARDTWTMQDSDALFRLLSSETNAPEKFRIAHARMSSGQDDPRGGLAVKLGIARYMMCRFADALAVLSAGTDNKDRRYVQALCQKHLRHYDLAVEEFRRAAERGWDADQVAAQVIECQALGGNVAQAEIDVERLSRAVGQTAETCFLQGLIAELSGRPDEACELYGQARSFEGFHVGATFRLAFVCDLHGDEDQAVALYQECVTHSPVHVSSLLNLAVLYEDVGDYDQAGECLKQILACNPQHQRAKLFLRDVEASKTMYFDEDQARRIAKHNAVLDIPVTDFELSVRARNCLKKMNLRTLGDLVMTTEAELLAYKNFGETSLREIKTILAAKSLHLGQGRDEGDSLLGVDSGDIRAEEERLRDTPIDRIEFSGRARKAIDSMDVTVLGDLADKSEPELLACKNFGQSSLNEVVERLAEYGLSLRELD